MAKHDEDGVVTVFSVFSSLAPVTWGQLPQPTHQTHAIAGIGVERLIEIAAQKRAIRILCPWILRCDDRGGRNQHPIEAVEEQGVHDGKMTSVFVGRPFAGVRPPPQKSGRDLPDERHAMSGARSRALMTLGIESTLSPAPALA